VNFGTDSEYNAKRKVEYYNVPEGVDEFILINGVPFYLFCEQRKAQKGKCLFTWQLKRCTPASHGTVVSDV